MQTCVRSKCILATLHRGGEGQNTYKMKFPTLVTAVVDGEATSINGRFCLFHKTALEHIG